MQVCSYMQVCNYASMHVNASMKVYKYANMQVCKYASMRSDVYVRSCGILFINMQSVRRLVRACMHALYLKEGMAW